MTETKFITQNEERWQQLEAFNQTLRRKGIRALSQIEVRAFAETFRAVGYHLAYAKTHFPDGTSLPYLTHIVGVAHNYYYVREQGSFSTVKEYFLHQFPQATRAVWHYAAVSAILFFVGMFFAYIYVANDIQRFDQIFPFELAGDGEMGEGEVIWDYALMSAVIMTNNIRVSIMALAFGITAGIGTIWILFYNGMIVGALASFIAATGGSRDTLIFWSLILPHGVPELAAIFLSGACGLMIGKALIMPGNYRRKDAVVKQAKQAVLLMPGIAAILIIAALIEGFFTPMGISPYFKLGFAFLTFVGLYLYFAKQ
ncbi:MAG: stage II sporulation protein M [Defluviitaleaceae bacterium]|nr:stage II sporulation protein M [Defluviitaleaceae bacterium]